MYHLIVRHMVRRFYGKFNRGDTEGIVRAYSPRLPFGHTFAGTHALGGTRHTAKMATRWFQRLFTLFDPLHVDIREILVKGWPWKTTIMVLWVDNGTCADGQPYHNEGIQVIHLRWGRIDGVYIHLDTQKVAEACQRMAQAGIPEAAAPLIED
jgi:ketosteroid isomerase-like protein